MDELKTRCKDKNGNVIHVGDILHVEEYPDQYVGGSLDFEGVVTIENGRAVVTYYDIGEEESYPVSMFPISGRHIWSEKWRYDYWKTAMLGGEPPEYLWKEDLYKQHFEVEQESRIRERTGGERMKPPYDDYCYECTGYGDDYYIDDDGELVRRCPDCPYFEQEENR